jgi:predicted CopG family antitoxin
MKTLNIKINDSAYRKLMNMQKRKKYVSLGDLVAYLVNQENRREQELLENKKDGG